MSQHLFISNCNHNLALNSNGGNSWAISEPGAGVATAGYNVDMLDPV